MDLKTISIEELPLVGPSYAKKLERLRIKNVWDLFHHVPFRFLDFSKNIPIYNFQIGETATIKGTVTSYVNQYTKKGRQMQIVTIADETGKVNAIWFNQIYLSKTFKKGTQVAIAGELGFFGRNKAVISPEYEIINENETQVHTGKLVPIYSQTAGVSSKWIRRRIFDAWKIYESYFEEFLEKKFLKKYDLVDFKLAVDHVHFPKTMEDFENGKKRLAFNELLDLHGANLKRKSEWDKNKIQKFEIPKFKFQIEEFTNSLPFELTNSQEKVIKEILLDLEKDIPMNRLLEGDVGSGKTVVAAFAIYIAFLNKRKSILMAPTQILAEQHYKTLTKLFENTNLKIGLWTGNTKHQGDFDLIIGTHALLNRKIDDFQLIIVDEQHKFGVEQREKLINKKPVHVLTMTATPIPRTVALTFFGDLSLSVLDELPKERKKIVTWIVPDTKRQGMYKWMEDQMKSFKSQVYIVCPLIENSDAETLVDVKNVNDEFEKIKKVFPKRNIGLLHGKLKAKEKSQVIDEFKNGQIDILVSTPVVEVGVDVSNATIMLIEGADRFGLASLHQLRGRVGRGNKKSYCLLFAGNNDQQKSIQRLKALTISQSGFELSELDLAMRGPGEIYGTKQSGIPELKIASWDNLEMIKDTRDVAETILNKL